MGSTQKVDSRTWEAEVLKGESLILVDFWAPWCGPCQMIAPVVEELAEEYQGKLKVLKLNTDENPDVAGRYQVMGIPTLMFFRKGAVIEKIVGAASKKQFKDKIDALLVEAG
jgi:thioredoxin 1